MSKDEDQDDKGSNEPDYYDEDKEQLEEEQERETGETTNQVFWINLLVFLVQYDNSASMRRFLCSTHFKGLVDDDSQVLYLTMVLITLFSVQS